MTEQTEVDKTKIITTFLYCYINGKIKK